MRNVHVAIWKLIASIMIMFCHIIPLGIISPFYDMYDCRVWVEFFLFVTGYFTAKHFLKGTVDEIDIGKTAIKYTINKFKRIYPYVILASLINFLFYTILDGFKLRELFGLMLECSLLQAAFPRFPSFYENGIIPFWYLSCLLFTLPLFCITILLLNETSYGRVYVFGLIAFLYYANMGVANVGWGVMGLFRVLAGLSVGAMIYDCSSILESCVRFWPISIISTIPLFMSFLISSDLYRYFFGAIPYKDYICVMCFCVGLIMVINSKLAISEKACKVIEKLSLMLYLFHWPMGKIVAKCYANNLNWIAYFGATFALALVLYFLHVGDAKK